MKTKSFSPASTTNFCKYLLVAKPSGEIAAKLVSEKKLFHEEYKQEPALEADSNIVIARFFAKESMEETIIRWMHRICRRHSGFPVRLNNYGGRPPDTIYIRVQDALPFKLIAEELKVIDAFISSCSCPSMQIFLQPNIKIAGKIPKELFFTALAQYSRKSFHEVFEVNELTLLKRPEADKSFKPLNIFSLLPLQLV